MSTQGLGHPRAYALVAFAVSIVAAAFLAPHAGAKGEDLPDLSGTYEAAGAFPNQEGYTGTVRIKKRKTVTLRKGPSYNFYDLEFKYSTGWEGVGVGSLVDGRFYFNLCHQGKFAAVAILRNTTLTPELATLKKELDRKQAGLEADWAGGKKDDQNSYLIKGDPWYTDVWRYPKYALFFRLDGDWGTEGIRPPLVKGRESTANPSVGAGEWWFKQRHYSDKGKDDTAVFGNFGQMIVEAPAEDGGIKITRRMEEANKFGEDWNCAGLMPDKETLIYVMGGDGTEGVGYYEVVGNTLKGRICDVDGLHPYAQTLTAPADVVSRNAGLFD